MSTSAISSLKDKIKISTMHMALLTMATGGVYPILWLYRNQNIIMEETQNRFSSDTLVIWFAVCFGFVCNVKSLIHPTINEYTYEYTYSGVAAAASLLVLGFGLAICVLYVVWSFKAKSALQQYALTQFRFELRMNAFYTMFFNVYYINYCINSMPEALAKHLIIHRSLRVSSEQPNDNE